MTDPHSSPPASGPAPFSSTPNAERYLLEADTLRRRQLRSALLHGSSRTWRDRRRIWPAVIAGIVLTAVISAAIAVYGAFEAQQRKQEQQRQERERISSQQELPTPTGVGSLGDGPIQRLWLLDDGQLSWWWGSARSAANS